MLPFASSSLSNQLTLPTLLWIWLHKFTMYTKMKSGGFGLCYHREEITFQLKTTTLFGVGGHTGQAGNSSFKNTSGQHTPALLPEEMVPPPPPSPPPLPSLFWHSLWVEQIEELPQAEFYWKKGIFNLEQFSNAIHHAAIQTIPASSRWGGNSHAGHAGLCQFKTSRK